MARYQKKEVVEEVQEEQLEEVQEEQLEEVQEEQLEEVQEEQLEEVQEEQLEEVMAETKPDDRILWRKLGGGSFRMADGRIIKPNQKFLASPDDIPKSFRDLVVPAEKAVREKMIKEADPDSPLPLPKLPLFQVIARSAGWYDVINTVTGKPVNEKGLREDAAKTLLAEINE